MFLCFCGEKKSFYTELFNAINNNLCVLAWIKKQHL